MNNKNQIKQKVPPWERPVFIMIITFIGGYMNGYTYITRHNILANMHTANMSKLGINIAICQWQDALSYFFPIVACILGAAFSELVKSILIAHKFKGNWRKLALVFEAISLFFIGLLPTSCPDIIVTNLVSFFMGYQLCLFRECLGIAFNTTICTGNIRNVGQLLYNTLDKKSKDSIRMLVIYTCLTFSFALGAIPGTLVSISISTKAVWVCSFILLVQATWINIYESNTV